MTPIQLNETNDCTVRAVSAAYAISYESAHKLLEAFGRKPRQGHFLNAFMHLMPKTVVLDIWHHKTVAAFINSARHMTYSQGCIDIENYNYLVIIQGHAFAIVDGKQVDSRDNSKFEIFRLYRIEK